MCKSLPYIELNTAILYQLKLGQPINTLPTIGFNMETITHNKLKLACWDVGGQEKIRPLWRHYYTGTNALIFVVDSNDRNRVKEAGEELHRIISDKELKDVTVLVFANKQDLPGAMSANEVSDALELAKLKTHTWHIQGSVATTGEGLDEGLEWLATVSSGGSAVASTSTATASTSKASS